jgi:hypothetical protein
MGLETVMKPGTRNLYRCDRCHNLISTIQTDEGLTPVMFRCKNPSCDGFMRSAWYPPQANQITPTFEWRKPDGFKFKPEERHGGGLVLRQIKSLAPAA